MTVLWLFISQIADFENSTQLHQQYFVLSTYRLVLLLRIQ